MNTTWQHDAHLEIEHLRERIHALRNAVDDIDQLLVRAIDAEHALRESEERFRLLVTEVQDYAIFMLDEQGCVVTWNIGAQRIKGYTPEEIVGRHFSTFYTPEDRQAGVPARALKIATQAGHYQAEGWRVRKDGSRFWASVVITALHDATGTLRGFSKVTRDLTERKHAEEQREQLREQEQQLVREREEHAHMEALVHVRNEFLTITAHELRTPVTSLLGYTQLLQRRADRGHASPERIQRTLSIVMKQAMRLDRLTTMLLDLVRLEDRRLALELHPIDLHMVVARVVNELQMLSEQHTLTIHTAPEPLPVEGDEVRLEQIVYNLLQNAIKYSPAGGTITLELRRDHDQAVMSIADPGLGIPADDLPHVFDRFYRATNVSSKHISGMGIGLYIVKELVTLHRGTIAAQSVPGQGSTFTVTLPLKP